MQNPESKKQKAESREAEIKCRGDQIRKRKK